MLADADGPHASSGLKPAADVINSLGNDPCSAHGRAPWPMAAKSLLPSVLRDHGTHSRGSMPQQLPNGNYPAKMAQTRLLF